MAPRTLRPGIGQSLRRQHPDHTASPGRLPQLSVLYLQYMDHPHQLPDARTQLAALLTQGAHPLVQLLVAPRETVGSSQS
ncbi:hypothetical protein [Streptomyces sp. NPDC048641]|uniref:hypothetical protein n=1 Tax=Streptomyces sp. NPDC048641 TaxID=3154825 RepID=UPI00342EBD20